MVNASECYQCIDWHDNWDDDSDSDDAGCAEFEWDDQSPCRECKPSQVCAFCCAGTIYNSALARSKLDVVW